MKPAVVAGAQSVPAVPIAGLTADPYEKLKKNPTASKEAAARLTAFLNAAVKGSQISLASDSTLAKLYEVEVATHFMRCFLAADVANRIELAGHFQDPSGVLAGVGGPSAGKGKSVTIVIPGKPELPKPKLYTYFKLVNAAAGQESLWLSIRIQTRNSVESKAELMGVPEGQLYGHVTELDVGIFRDDLVEGVPPSYELLSLAASCKLTACSRADVSNAEFLRAMTAKSTGGVTAPSRAGWATPAEVPADPPIPVYLASSSATLSKWKDPLEAVGIYCAPVSFK